MDITKRETSFLKKAEYNRMRNQNYIKFLRKVSILKAIIDIGYVPEPGRKHVVNMRDILKHTLKQEENCLKIASFSVRGVDANYNIKFKNATQAHLFVTFKVVRYSFIQQNLLLLLCFLPVK